MRLNMRRSKKPSQREFQSHFEGRAPRRGNSSPVRAGPRSKIVTRLPVAARRQAETAPPKPEPMTIASEVLPSSRGMRLPYALQLERGGADLDEVVFEQALRVFEQVAVDEGAIRAAPIFDE